MDHPLPPLSWNKYHHISRFLTHEPVTEQILSRWRKASKWWDRMLRQSKWDKRRHGTVSMKSDIHTTLSKMKIYLIHLCAGKHNKQSLIHTDSDLAHPGSSYAFVKAWLGPQPDNDMNSQRHEDNRNSRYPGSCEWLASHRDFMSWVASPSSEKMKSIWLKGTPGAGKSHVCSKAIDHVADSQELCLYYFYRFDYQFSPEENKLLMSSRLIDQLFRQVWRDDPAVVGRIRQFIEVSEKNTTALAQVAQMLLKPSNQEEVSQPEQASNSVPPRRKIYLLLDGLDETQGPVIGRDVLKAALSLFDGLEEEVCLRLWVSSQDSMDLSNYLLQCAVINLDDHAEPDVRNHLARVVPNIMAESPEFTEFEVNGQPCESSNSRHPPRPLARGLSILYRGADRKSNKYCPGWWTRFKPRPRATFSTLNWSSTN